MKVFTLILSLLSFLMAGWALWRTGIDSSEISGMTEQVEAALHEKPEMILSAIESLSKKMNEGKKAGSSAHSEQDEKIIMENEGALFNQDTDPTSGNPDGDIRVVEFFDYRCGYCRRAYGNIHEAAKKDGNVKIIYKELPIFDGPPLQTKAALAAHLQGRYNDYHKALMNSDGQWDEEKLASVAEKLGLDVARWKEDFGGEAVEIMIAQNKELAKNLGINSTPAFVIEGEIMPGALSVEQFIDAFKAVRAKKD